MRPIGEIGSPPRFFLSHSSRDKPSVRRLVDELTRRGLRVWLDESEIKVGERIAQKVQEGLETSDFLIVWLTPHAVASKWVAPEWQAVFHAALESGKTQVLPVLAEACEIPFWLRGVKYADFTQSWDEGLAELLLALPKPAAAVSPPSDVAAATISVSVSVDGTEFSLSARGVSGADAKAKFLRAIDALWTS